MVVLGVDPGLRVAGYALISVYDRRFSVIAYDALRLSPKMSVAHRVGYFYEHMRNLIADYGVSVVSLETPFLGRNAQNFLKLGYVRGALHVLVYQYHLTLCELTPRQVKQSVTGFGGASKDQVVRMVYWLCPNMRRVAYHDITDAMAVAMSASLSYM